MGDIKGRYSKCMVWIASQYLRCSGGMSIGISFMTRAAAATYGLTSMGPAVRAQQSMLPEVAPRNSLQ